MVNTSAPPAPKEVQIDLYEDEKLVVSWEPQEGRDHTPAVAYEVTLQYFDFDGTMVEAFYKTVERVNGSVDMKEFGHPSSAFQEKDLKSCVVKASVKAIGNNDDEGGTAKRQISWDYQLAPEATALPDPTKQHALLSDALAEYRVTKGNHIRILVIGGQHHGKSSFVNHLDRCLRGRLDIGDEMETAPAGVSENTHETKTLQIKYQKDFIFEFIDTPAFSALNQDTLRLLSKLLSNGINDGTRRADFEKKAGHFSAPPDAAIVVVSLMHWIAAKSELQEYLASMSKELKNASQGTVSFPYVVAVTKRDEFLSECQAPRPKQALDKIIKEIQQYANTEKVHVVENFKESSRWKPVVLDDTLRLLRDVMIFAKNQNTNRTSGRTVSYFAIAAAVLLVAAMWSTAQ